MPVMRVSKETAAFANKCGAGNGNQNLAQNSNQFRAASPEKSSHNCPAARNDSCEGGSRHIWSHSTWRFPDWCLRRIQRPPL